MVKLNFLQMFKERRGTFILTFLLMCGMMTANAQGEFITEWTVDASGEITIPGRTSPNFSYNYNIEWIDMSTNTQVGSATGVTSSSYTISGLSNGKDYQVKITGNFPCIYFNNSGDKDKIKKVVQWGDIEWERFYNAFYGCTNLEVTAKDEPDLITNSVADLTNVFKNCTSLTGTVSKTSWNWDVSTVYIFTSAFQGATSFNGNISSWNTSKATSMDYMFDGAESFNRSLNGWNTENVTSMYAMFRNTTVFNNKLSAWDVSKVTDFGYMFSGAKAFNNSISGWDVSSATSMINMFMNAISYKQSMKDWNTINVTNMYQMFFGATSFNGDVLNWKTDNVINMAEMFRNAEIFNKSLVNWNVSSVTNFTSMFEGAKAFNQDISGWDVSNATTMEKMFFGATNFNCGLSKSASVNLDNWDVSNVTTFKRMFAQTEAFNRSVNWNDVSSATDMENMFNGATSFNQDINWNISNVQSLGNFLAGASSFNKNLGHLTFKSGASVSNFITTATGMDCIHFSATIMGWAANSSQPDNLNFGNDKINKNYIDIADESHTTLTSKGWILKTDGVGANCLDDAFVGRWVATGGEIIIPTAGTIFDYDIVFKNLTNSGIKDVILTDLTGGVTESGLESGSEYEVSIVRNFTRFYFNNKAENNKDDLLKISQWGNLPWTNFNGAFHGCGKLQITATDVPNLEAVKDFTSMFARCTELTGEDANWEWEFNTDNKINLSTMFYLDGEFVANTGISSWETGSVSSMTSMFNGASSFNQDINTNGDKWDVSSVTSMANMFKGATSFEKDLNDWNVGEVTSMANMFDGASAFNGDISAWKPGKVKNFSSMFLNASAFEGNLSAWTTDEATTMASMFYGATKFNGDVSGWNTKNVTNMSNMFRATSFNQDINTDGDKWDVSSVTTMANMFYGNSAFDGNISDWKPGSVTTFSSMFYNAIAFNQDLSKWDVSSATTFTSMFRGAISFNSDVSNWDVSNATAINEMFRDASAFNQSLGDWSLNSTLSGTKMRYMIYQTGMSCSNYALTLIGWSLNPSTPNGITLSVNGTTRSPSARQAVSVLEAKGWTITDAGEDLWCDPFVTSWNTEGTSTITIPTYGTGYDFVIDWGDASPVESFSGSLNGLVTHTYSADGDYTIRIAGTFPRLYFRNYADESLKIKEVNEWGTNSWAGFDYMFKGCNNLEIVAEDVPNLSYVNSFNSTFFRCGSLGDKGNWNWNTKNIKNMSETFAHCANFDGDISNWNTENVTNMDHTFYNCGSFNQPLNWNTSNVLSMANLFYNASEFNQDLNWNTENVTSMKGVFNGASSFDGDITNWDVSKVTDMSYIFNDASAFNQDITGWDVSNVTNFRSAFYNASEFNQDLGAWTLGTDLNNIIDMVWRSGLDCDNYNSTLNSWADQVYTAGGDLDNLVLGATGLFYGPSAVSARTDLTTTFGWTITGDTYNEDCGNGGLIPTSVFNGKRNQNGSNTNGVDNDLDRISSSDLNNNLNKVFSYNVYPNPSSSFVNIEVNGSFNYVINDIYGRMIQNGSANNFVTINDLSKGVYFVRIMQDNVAQTVKIIVE